MLDFAYKAVMVMLAFGSLICIHEFGHFVAARLMGVRVERFSIGFGPFLFGFRSRRGGTHYGLAWIPIGGYVQMTGQHDFDRPALTGAPDEFTSKSVPARMLIIVAGVVMNLLFALVVLVVAYRLGVFYVAPEVGACEPGEFAYKAGFREGDRLLAVEGQPVRDFEDFLIAVAVRGTGRKIAVRLRRGGVEQTLLVQPQKGQNPPIATLDIEPPKEERSFAIGATNSYKKQLVLVSVVAGQPAALAGLRAGDLILSVVEGANRLEAPRSGGPFSQLIQDSGGRPILITVLRGKEQLTLTVRAEEVPDEKSNPPVYRIGVGLPVDSRITAVESGSPAEKAGLQPGDLLTTTVVGNIHENSVQLGWKRGDEKHSRKFGPVWIPAEPDRNWTKLVLPRLKGQTEQYLLFSRRPDTLGREVTAFERAGTAFLQLLQRIQGFLHGLITGGVSPKNSMGPLGIIGAIAVSLEPGYGYYLWLVAFISLNLAVLNILPIPILDGGHLVFLGAELIRRRPVSRRIQEVAQLTGLVLLLALVIYVTKNDILRYFPGSK